MLIYITGQGEYESKRVDERIIAHSQFDIDESFVANCDLCGSDVDCVTQIYTHRACAKCLMQRARELHSVSDDIGASQRTDTSDGVRFGVAFFRKLRAIHALASDIADAIEGDDSEELVMSVGYDVADGLRELFGDARKSKRKMHGIIAQIKQRIERSQSRWETAHCVPRERRTNDDG